MMILDARRWQHPIEIIERIMSDLEVLQVASTWHQQIVNLVSSFQWFFGGFGSRETWKPETWKPSLKG